MLKASLNPTKLKHLSVALFRVLVSPGLPSTGGSLSQPAASKTPQAAAAVGGDADADLEARLDNLRRQ